MPLSAKVIRSQIERLTIGLIEHSLCNQQNFPIVVERGRTIVDVSYSGVGFLSIALKDVAYKDIYDAYDCEGAYNIKMVDGALIQMLYRYDGEELKSHRLAFFPSPYLEQFQNEPEIYENDELFAEVLSRSIVAFPMRFDFNSDDEIHIDLEHPKSHLTLGEYTNCRIPVSGPVTPYRFVDFVLRNFYNTSHRSCASKLVKYDDAFEACITEGEKRLVHMQLHHT